MNWSRCAAPGCGREIAHRRLMCREHWYRVPKPLRDEVWAAWRARLSEESGAVARHAEAKAAAVRALA